MFAKVTEALATGRATVVSAAPLRERRDTPIRSLSRSALRAIGSGGLRTRWQRPKCGHDLVESMGPFGVALVGIGTAAAAAGIALWELGEHAAAAGGKVNDVGEKTGVSVPMVDRYGKAFAVAGSDIDVFSNSMFMLQRGIGEGTQKTADGLAKIGLSVEELKSAGPDRYMALIAEGFHNTEDPAAKASAAMDIFNKQGREIIPTLNKLAESMHDVSDIEPWTDEQAREAEHFEMQMASLKVHTAALAEAFGRELIPAMTWLTDNGIPAFKWAVDATLHPRDTADDSFRRRRDRLRPRWLEAQLGATLALAAGVAAVVGGRPGLSAAATRGLSARRRSLTRNLASIASSLVRSVASLLLKSPTSALQETTATRIASFTIFCLRFEKCSCRHITRDGAASRAGTPMSANASKQRRISRRDASSSRASRSASAAASC